MLLFSALALAGPPQLRLPDRGPRPASYEIQLRVDPDAPTFAGQETLSWRLDRPVSTVWLNARNLRVDEATWRSGQRRAPARVRAQGEWLRIDLPGRAASFELDLGWTGSVSEVETQGVFSQVAEGERYLFTQFEATDARAAFPSLDQPDVKTPFTLRVRVPDGLLAVAKIGRAHV